MFHDPRFSAPTEPPKHTRPQFHSFSARIQQFYLTCQLQVAQPSQAPCQGDKQKFGVTCQKWRRLSGNWRTKLAKVTCFGPRPTLVSSRKNLDCLGTSSGPWHKSGHARPHTRIPVWVFLDYSSFNKWQDSPLNFCKFLLFGCWRVGSQLSSLCTMLLSGREFGWHVSLCNDCTNLKGSSKSMPAALPKCLSIHTCHLLQ